MGERPGSWAWLKVFCEEVEGPAADGRGVGEARRGGAFGRRGAEGEFALFSPHGGQAQLDSWIVNFEGEKSRSGGAVARGFRPGEDR